MKRKFPIASKKTGAKMIPIENQVDKKFSGSGFISHKGWRGQRKDLLH
jgi:hypothetical protein